MATSKMGSDRSATSMEGSAGQQSESRTQQAGSRSGQAETPREVMGMARGQLMEQLQGQKNRLASGLNVVSDVLDESGQRFRDESGGAMAGYPGAAADQIRRLADQLETSDLNDLVQQAQDVARDRPALFLGGAFALGMIGARFLRSSPPGGRQGSMSGSFRGSTRENYGAQTRPSGGMGSTGTGYGGSAGAGASGTQGLRSTEALR